MAAVSQQPQISAKDNYLAKPMKRCNKPLMERRRRERINSSLNQLKSLVLDALKKDTSQYSKLEKADILEMTVKHLRSVQRHQLTVAAATDTSVVTKYHMGFSECATEVCRYLSSVDGLSVDVRGRLMQHLGSCMQPNRAHSPQQLSAPHNTQPVHIQNPIATQSPELPGTTLQTPSRGGSPVAPLHGVQYLGAFQVIPAGFSSSADLATFIVPSTSPTSVGLLSNGSPAYGVIPQAHHVTVSPQPIRAHNTVSPPPMTYVHKFETERTSPDVVRTSPDVVRAHVSLKTSLKEEKVWRPW